jgi:hypothetical protein
MKIKLKGTSVGLHKNINTINNVLEVTGTIEEFPKDYGAWLAVQKGNKKWPKIEVDTIRDNKGYWMYKIPLESGSYSLVLCIVNEEGNRQIKFWKDILDQVNSVNQVNSVPGIIDIHGLKKLFHSWIIRYQTDWIFYKNSIIYFPYM